MRSKAWQKTWFLISASYYRCSITCGENYEYISSTSTHVDVNVTLSQMHLFNLKLNVELSLKHAPPSRWDEWTYFLLFPDTSTPSWVNQNQPGEPTSQDSSQSTPVPIREHPCKKRSLSDLAIWVLTSIKTTITWVNASWHGGEPRHRQPQNSGPQSTYEGIAIAWNGKKEESLSKVSSST